MGDAYDRERTAALIDEARKLTAALKIEAGEIKAVIDKAFDANDGDEAGSVDEGVAVPPKFKWWFWR
jgi:hypothetical protein